MTLENTLQHSNFKKIDMNFLLMRFYQLNFDKNLKIKNIQVMI